MMIKVRVIKRSGLVKDNGRGMSKCPSSISMIHNTFSADSNEGKKAVNKVSFLKRKCQKTVKIHTVYGNKFRQ